MGASASHFRLGTWRLVTGTSLLLLWSATLSCDDSTTEPDDEGAPADTLLAVDSYLLPEGETAEFPAGFEIVATDSVDIAGDLIVRAERPGDFTIRVLEGDLRISGSVVVEGASTPRRSAEDRLPAGSAGSPRGTRLFFIVDRPGGTIYITSGSQLRSGDGRDALDETLVTGAQHVGAVGAPGGDIILRARGGNIFLENLTEPPRPVFVLGRGGHGANVTVDRDAFQTSDGTLEVFAGRGGDSGILMLEADVIQGIPTAEEIGIDVEPLAGGAGGDGGFVMWHNSNRPIFPVGEPTSATYPLGEITFRGGDGGNGATQGGDGGFAAYWSLRTINERGDPIATVSVTGGDGGDVFASPVPVGLAQGGEGGEYLVQGNYGWAGAPADSGGPIHGADGGDVTGRGGKGGSVGDEVAFRSAIGGDGGNSEVARTALLADLRELGYSWVGTSDLADHSALWVVAGFPGSGADSECDGCPGGDSGSSGTAVATGGDGGDVPNRPGARGGRGGDVWEALSFLPDDPGGALGISGGDGNPPGEGGCFQAAVAAPGTGGTGFLPGEDGVFLDLWTEDGTECWPDGALCGENLTCDTGKPCFEQLGASFTASEVRTGECVNTVSGLTEIRRTALDQSGTLSFDQALMDYVWTVDEIHSMYFEVLFEGESNVITDTTWVDTRQFQGQEAGVSPLAQPQCFPDGSLYLPNNGVFNHVAIVQQGDDITCTTTAVLSFAGCNPQTNFNGVETGGNYDPGDWECCPSPTYTMGGGCP